MIDSKLLTPEFGFEDGVVVEVVGISGSKTIGHWMGVRSDYANQWRCMVEYGTDDRELFQPIQSNVISIRPLTGPMAIWNFAPDWAMYFSFSNDSMRWWATNPFTDQPDDWRWKRPWWAMKAKP